MLEKLLASTYSAFDRDPNGQIVLRVQHPDGVAWRVADRVITASTEVGAPLLVFGLRDKTIQQLATAFSAVGCTIAYLNPDYAPRAADTLLDGRGRQSEANGDALRAYDSELWALLDSYAIALEDLDNDVSAAVRQLYIGTAEGEWLDVWGEYFGLLRETGENDTTYRLRMIAETLRPRVNKYAIEKAITDVTGHAVDVYEPWQDTFVLSKSELDGKDHMQNGDFYIRNVIQPISPVSIRWERVMQIVERNRAAGVIVALPRYAGKMQVDARAESTSAVDASVQSVYVLTAHTVQQGRLNEFALGQNEPDTRNYKMIMSQLITLHNNDPLPAQASLREAMRTIRRANIALSDGDPVGAINSVFQRTYWLQPPDFMKLSDRQQLSNYVGRIRLGMVDEIRTLYAGHVSFAEDGMLVIMGREDIRPYGPVLLNMTTEQQDIAMEFTYAEHADYSDDMNPVPWMWAWGGAGAWNADQTTGWDDDKTWGEGLPQNQS